MFAILVVLVSACRVATETALQLDTSEVSSPAAAENVREGDGVDTGVDRDVANDGAQEASDGTATDRAANDGEEIDADVSPDQSDRGARNGEDTSAQDPAAERISPLDDESIEPRRPASNNAPGGEIDFTLERSDVDCDEDELNDFGGVTFTVAHLVVDGNLGAACLGEPDERLLTAWRVLAEITPPGQLADLGLFGGFSSTEIDGTTLAFVNPLDTTGSLYHMAINLQEAENDPDELMLTMAHEFAHVFSSLSTQIDRSVRFRDCDTYHNTEGCFRPDSLMWAWIQEFWGDGLIDEIDPWVSPSNLGGTARCSINPSFLGSYAASNPEEDFAEAFSAFVFRLEVATPELQAKLDWFAEQPGLAEFQDRAIASDLGPLGNFFEPCG